MVGFSSEGRADSCMANGCHHLQSNDPRTPPKTARIAILGLSFKSRSLSSLHEHLYKKWLPKTCLPSLQEVLLAVTRIDDRAFGRHGCQAC